MINNKLRGTKSIMEKTSQRRNLHDLVARNIGAAILAGTYPPGALLPNEAEWTKTFSASRTSVREAIKTLSAKGLIMSRPKIGSRVQPRANWNMMDRDVLDWHDAATDKDSFLSEVQEARRLFEPGVAALAAKKRSEAQLARLRTAFEIMQTARIAAEIVAADTEFHKALIAAANNDLISPFGIIIEKALHILFDFTTRRNPHYVDALKLHGAIVIAVANSDSAAAHAAMLALITDTDNLITTR